MSVDILTAPGVTLPEDPARTGILAQLDAVRDFMTIHPSFPVTSADVHESGYAHIRKFCASPAEVDFIAGTIGIAARWRCATQYVASLRVGLRFQYEVAYVAPSRPAPVVTEDEGSDAERLVAA